VGTITFSYLQKEELNKLPEATGVYCFKSGKKFLYIGKAANIKERVKNHFQQPSYRDGLFLDKITKIGYWATDSEIEALILEANLIKKCQPKYNIVWRDDKNYFYVGVTKEDLPRIFTSHQVKENANYIGPFIEGTGLKRTLTYLRKVFPYYTAKKHPKNSCLWCNLKLCPGPFPDKKEYQKNIKNLIAVLKGKSKAVLKNSKREMKKASASQDYEGAAKIRDQIESLERVLAHAKISEEYSLSLPWHKYGVWSDVEKRLKKILETKNKIVRIEAYDISNIQGEEATGSMVTFINGLPDKNFYRRFKIKTAGKPNDVAMIKEVLSRRLKHVEWPYPDLILIDGGKAQLNAAKEVCARLSLAQIKVAAIAKKKNKLYIEGRKKPILLKSLPREIFNLILQLRDEAHRFAISYHKKLRQKYLLGK